MHRNSAGTALAGLIRAGYVSGGNPAHITLCYPPEDRT